MHQREFHHTCLAPTISGGKQTNYKLRDKEQNSVNEIEKKQEPTRTKPKKTTLKNQSMPVSKLQQSNNKAATTQQQQCVGL